MAVAARAGRRANIIAIVAVLCLVVLMAITSLDTMTSADATSTARLRRELLATYLGESIAAQIESRASRQPWERRFWLLEAQARGTGEPGTGIVASVAFDRTTTHVNLSMDTLPPSDYDYVGVVKDIDPARRDYRLYVEVTLRGERYAFTWDKRWSESLLGGLNRDGSILDKRVDVVPEDPGPLDEVIDELKASAAAPAPDLVGQLPQAARPLTRMREDTDALGAVTVLPARPLGAPPKIEVKNDGDKGEEKKAPGGIGGRR